MYVIIEMAIIIIIIIYSIIIPSNEQMKNKACRKRTRRRKNGREKRGDVKNSRKFLHPFFSTDIFRLDFFVIQMHAFILYACERAYILYREETKHNPVH